MPDSRYKVQGEHYNTLKAAIQHVVEHHGVDEIKRVAAKKGVTKALWGLYWQARDYMPYDLTQMNEYTDKNIESALRGIAAELGLRPIRLGQKKRQ